MNNPPIRPVPRSSESLRGFVTRVASKYCYSNSFYLYKLLELTKGKHQEKLYMLREGISLSKLACFTRTSESRLTKLSFHDELKDTCLVNEDINFINQFGFYSEHTQICPLCLKEGIYLRKIWDLKIITSCHIHNIFLIDRCSKCNAKISPYRIPLNRCSCGIEYPLSSTTQAPYTDLEKYINDKLTCESKTENVQVLQKIDLLSLINLFVRLAYSVTRYCFDGKNNIFVENVISRNEVFNRTFEIFKNWPYNLFWFLKQIREKSELNGSKPFKGIQSGYGNFYHNLYNNLTGQQYDFIRKQFEQFLFENWQDGVLGKALLKNISSQINSYFVSGTEACRRLNVEYKKVIALVEEKEIEGVIILKKSKKSILIKTSSIEDYNNKKNLWVTKENVRKSLLLSHRNVDELVNAGLLRGEYRINSIGKKEWRFFKNDLDSIVGFFHIHLSRENVNKSDIIGLSELLKLIQYSRIKLSSFIIKVKDGAFKVIELDMNSELGLQRYGFLKQQIVKWIEEITRTLATLSIRKAADMLGENIYSVKYWVEAGIIEKDITISSLKTTYKAIEKFKECYITLGSLIRLKNTNNRKILLELNLLNIEPILKPKIINGQKIGYLYRRKDLENYLK